MVDNGNGNGDRRRRPQMSIGSIVGIGGLIVTSLGGLVGGVHYADSITNKLDQVGDQVKALGDVKTEVSKIQNRMDGFERWLQHLSDQIDGKKRTEQ